MQLYRLRCECGAEIRVRKGQAGGDVTCSGCGQAVVVPTLRDFGQLPLADSDTPLGSTPARLSLRQGLIAGGLVTAVVCWALAAWISSATRVDFDIERVRFEIARAPFMRVYAAWKELSVASVERDETVGEYRAKNLGRVGRSSATVFTVLGGIGILITLGGAVLVRGPKGTSP